VAAARARHDTQRAPARIGQTVIEDAGEARQPATKRPRKQPGEKEASHKCTELTEQT
jgi:hypothetical protein